MIFFKDMFQGCFLRISKNKDILSLIILLWYSSNMLCFQNIVFKITLPVGSRKSGRSGVRCITLSLGLGGGRTAAVLALLASAGRGGGLEVDGGRRRGRARRMEVDGGGWAAVGTPGSDGWSRFAHFGTSRNHPLWKWQCGHFLLKKWLGAENTRRTAPPKTPQLHMQKNTRPDANSQSQSPQSVVNSC